MTGPLVGVIMGSRSDWETMKHAADTLEELGVAFETRVISAHRTPDLVFEYASTAAARGVRVIVAGARGGIVGGGQLGRMLALAGYPLDIRCTVLDPSSDACASQVAPAIVGAYGDRAALATLAGVSDVVTYEFENVPVDAVRSLAE